MIKKNIHIENSYNEWLKSNMYNLIRVRCFDKYKTFEASSVLNRTYKSMYKDWYRHNLCYWFTKPFIKNPKIKKLNEKFKHLDLEEHLENENPQRKSLF